MPTELPSSPEHLAALQLGEAMDLPRFEQGTVWLAGAGPGDLGTITALGLYAIAHADAVLYDALVNPALLKAARPGAELIFAGKRRGAPSVKQDDISQTLIALARKSLRILRLKGGDPFVFGRGGEEALALARAGVPFRIVPGVTAGIGGLAYAGIPVTHRDTNHSVTFVTGHGTDGGLPDLDWNAIAKGAPTLVIYMALAHAEEIAAKLIAAGRAAGEPAAIVSNASRENQNVRVTTLAGLAKAAQASAAPAVVVIGENVKLRETLDWFAASTALSRSA